MGKGEAVELNLGSTLLDKQTNASTVVVGHRDVQYGLSVDLNMKLLFLYSDTQPVVTFNTQCLCMFPGEQIVPAVLVESCEGQELVWGVDCDIITQCL